MLTVKPVYRLSDVSDDLKWATNTHIRGRTLAFILLDSGTSKVKSLLFRQKVD